MKTIAAQIAETLAAIGVKRIYGIVGDSLNALTEAIRGQGQFEWLHVRREESAPRSDPMTTAICADAALAVRITS
jgi:pyruvate dehydrogenase (quinone)